ncbi:TRAP transporter small permease subunit [uncultured Cohaesibacter sp.]|uniref:TRAP transporter small permease n=1 Tax=uncultured Cohaesibacter sp. TaxID=1002546 RepID=UPI0029C760FC|nr:TRAP transporter small permease subunit [uncultured Cohaesibacter sp.]
MNAATPIETGGSRREGQVPFLRFLDTVIDLLEGTGKLVAAACLTFMFVALLVNVVLRYAFGSGIAWAYEIHAVLLPWLVSGGIVIASARGRHIAISLASDMLQNTPRRVLLIVIQLIILIIAIGVLWSSQPILRASKFQSLSTLGIKQIWGYSALVYAFAAIAIVAACETLRLIGGVDIDQSAPQDSSLS